MSEKFAFEKVARPNFETLDVDLDPKLHSDIQHALTDLSMELLDDSNPNFPNITNDRVRLVPISGLTPVEGDDIKSVGTIIDINISSHRPYYADSSENTYGIVTELVSGASVPLEEISTTLIKKDLKASEVELVSRNQLADLESSMTFAQLTQSLAKLTGIPTIERYGHPDNNFRFDEAIDRLFRDLTSKQNASKVKIDEQVHEKTYENEDFELIRIPGSPVDYESTREVKLEIQDYLIQGVRSLGLTAVGYLNFYERGLVRQEFSYKYFVGSRNKPLVSVKLSSEDFTHDQLRDLVKNTDLDAVSTTTAAIELLKHRYKN